MNEQLVQRIARCQDLPTLPTVAVQVLDLAQKADVDIAEIARIISKDPALSGKILRTVNSSFYGRSQNVGTISHALVILGLQSVKTLVLGFSLVTHLKSNAQSGFNYLAYWKRSIYAATAARIIAARIGVVQQEEAFLSALLQDIGMMVLNSVLGEEYGPVHARVTTHADLAAAELDTLGMSHEEAGRIMAKQWKLPPLLAVPISFHHSPDQVPDPSLRKLAELTQLAGATADVFVDDAPSAAIATVRRLCQERYNMPGADCDALLAEIGRSTTEVASLFEINIGAGVTFEDVLKKANQALVEITLQSQQQATALQVQNQKLREEASTDALTGLANRGRFDKFLSEQFGLARRQKQPLAMLLLDIDRFKSVNDTQGHQAGDQVLRAVAKLVAKGARAGDLVARYGGEEIALVLVNTVRAQAAAVAEGIRRAVAAKPVPAGRVELPVTVSLGVAVFDPSSPFTEAAHLLKAADLAVYAAKHAGRNCVRVFSLKPRPMSSAA